MGILDTRVKLVSLIDKQDRTSRDPHISSPALWRPRMIVSAKDHVAN